MSEIQSYIEKLDIKKVPIGGFDKEAVYTSMQELSSMYQKEIVQLKAEKERLETEGKTTAEELEQAKKDIQLLKYQLAEGQKSQKKYDLSFNALTQAVNAINASRDKVVEEAKTTAEEIIAEANEKYESISQECLFQRQQKELVLSKITDVKQRFGSSMENVRSILTEMLTEVNALQKGGLEQEFSGGETSEEAEIGELPIAFNDETSRLVRMITRSVSKHGS